MDASEEATEEATEDAVEEATEEVEVMEVNVQSQIPIREVV
jgi:hypothetical protein